MYLEGKIIFYAYRMSQASQVFLPIKMRYKMAKQNSTNVRNQIYGWFNGTAAKNAVTQGYENKEHSSRLLGQIYLSARVVRPAVQNATAIPTPVVQNTSAQPPVLPVGAHPPVMLRGTSEENPIDFLDSDDELFIELNLTPDQEERVRRRFDRIRSETSSSFS